MSLTQVLLDIQCGVNIDDFFSLALALCSPEIDLLGVTTVSDRDGEGTRMAKRLVRAYGHSIPVIRGSAQPHGIQYDPARAVQFLIDTVRAHYGEVTLITNGPLTNIALAMEHDPKFEGGVEQIITMAGWAGQHLPEWNVRCDPWAVDRLLESTVPLVLFCRDSTNACRLNQMYLDALSRSDAEGTALLLRYLHAWQATSTEPLTLHDPLTIAYVCKPELVTLEEVQVRREKDEPILSIGPEGKQTLLCRHVDTLSYFNLITMRLDSAKPIEEDPSPRLSAIHFASPPYLYSALKLEYPPGWALPMRSRSENQVIHVKRGDLTVTVSGATHVLTSGDLFFIPAETRYSLATQTGMILAMVDFHFQGSGAADTYLRDYLKPTPMRIPPKYAGAAGRVVDELARAYLLQNVESVLRSKALLYELLALLTRIVNESSDDHDFTPEQTLYVEAARRIIEDNLTRRFSLDALAAAVGVSKYHLSRLFRRRYGVSPGEYHTTLRMRQAAALLSMGHLSISEIAVQLGYMSVQSFSKAFKQHFGVNPSDHTSLEAHDLPTRWR